MLRTGSEWPFMYCVAAERSFDDGRQSLWTVLALARAHPRLAA